MADHPYCTEHDQPLGWCLHHKRSLLGKRVRVILEDRPSVICTGKLLAFSEDGGFEILEDDGMVHYCWPMLSIEAVDDGIHT